MIETRPYAPGDGAAGDGQDLEEERGLVVEAQELRLAVLDVL